MLLSKDDSNIMKAFGFIAIELGDNRSFLLPYFRGVGLGRCEGDQRRDNNRVHGVAWQFEHYEFFAHKSRDVSGPQVGATYI